MVADPKRSAPVTHRPVSTPGPMSAIGLSNALTIDVEDYFQVSAFARHIDRNQWHTRECRIERNMDLTLELLDRYHIKATFFMLGWIADRYPQVVRSITEGGHELASHGYGHKRVTELTEGEFFGDVMMAKDVLEQISGTQIRGYRAPSFSLRPDNQWAFDALRRAGHTYSSSIYPVRHDHYGAPDSPRFLHTVHDLLEVPPSTLRLFGRNWPASGGGYFRLLPYEVSRWMLRRINWVEKQSALFYFHPWEIDPNQPRVAGIGVKTRFRHYVNLSHMQAKLERLFEDFRWGRMDEIFVATAGPSVAMVDSAEIQRE